METTEIYAINLPACGGLKESTYNPADAQDVRNLIGAYGYALYMPNPDAVKLGAVPLMVQRTISGTAGPLYPELPKSLPVNANTARALVRNWHVGRLYPYMVEGEHKSGAKECGLDPAIGDYYLLVQ